MMLILSVLPSIVQSEALYQALIVLDRLSWLRLQCFVRSCSTVLDPLLHSIFKEIFTVGQCLEKR